MVRSGAPISVYPKSAVLTAQVGYSRLAVRRVSNHGRTLRALRPQASVQIAETLACSFPAPPRMLIRDESCADNECLSSRDQHAMTNASAYDLVVAQLADPRSQWSLGTFGAIAEFMRDADEPSAFRAAGSVSVVTARGAIRIDPFAELRLVASETAS